jgi:hypothetical protein
LILAQFTQSQLERAEQVQVAAIMLCLVLIPALYQPLQLYPWVEVTLGPEDLPMERLEQMEDLEVELEEMLQFPIRPLPEDLALLGKEIMEAQLQGFLAVHPVVEVVLEQMA